MRRFARLLATLAILAAAALPAGAAGAAGAASAASAAATARGGAGYKAEYKVSTVLGAPFPWGVAAETWAELVKRHTAGRIVMRVYPNAQLVHGDQTKEFTALRDGSIDAAVSSTINWSPQVTELNLFALPFLLPDHAAIDALTKGHVGDALFEAIRAKGVEPLAWGENGFRQLSNSKRPVLAPADLRGLKIRVVGAPLFNDIFSALGANPKPMSWADAMPALASGAVDGQENPLTVYVSAKLETLGQTQVTLWNYVADPLIFAFSARAWETFSPEDRVLVRAAAGAAGRLCIQLSRDGDTAAIRALPALGVTLSRPDAAQQQAFEAATRPVFARWAKRIGPELVAQAQAAIAQRQR